MKVYFGNHIVSSLLPEPPKSRVSLSGGDAGGPVKERGRASLSDEVRSSLIDSARREGHADQCGLVGYRERLYGGDMVRNSFRINHICSIDKGRDELKNTVVKNGCPTVNCGSNIASSYNKTTRRQVS